MKRIFSYLISSKSSFTTKSTLGNVDKYKITVPKKKNKMDICREKREIRAFGGRDRSGRKDEKKRARERRKKGEKRRSVWGCGEERKRRLCQHSPPQEQSDHTKAMASRCHCCEAPALRPEGSNFSAPSSASSAFSSPFMKLPIQLPPARPE